MDVANSVRGSACPISVFRGQAPLHAPAIQDCGDLGAYKKAGTVPVGALAQELVVIRERVAHICDQRQPRCCFRKGDVQAGAVDRVVDHGCKLVRRDSGRQPTQRNLDVTAFCHIATPAARPMIMPDLGDIIGYAHWEIEPRADPCLLPSLPISRLPPDPDRGGSAWWPPYPLLLKPLAVLPVLVLTLVNAFGATLMGRWETVIVVVKVAILVLFAAVGLCFIRPGYLSPELWPETKSILFGAGVLFIGYEGFGLITNAAADMRDPRKLLPRALYTSVILVIALYLAVSLTVTANFSDSESQRAKDYALAEAAKPFLGQFGFRLIAIAALFSTASAINATLFGSANGCYMIARHGDLPAGLSRTAWKDATGGAPVAAAPNGPSGVGRGAGSRNELSELSCRRFGAGLLANLMKMSGDRWAPQHILAAQHRIARWTAIPPREIGKETCKGRI